jgi:hypothetical protein
MANFIAEDENPEWVVDFTKALETDNVPEVRNDALVMILPPWYRVPSEQYDPKVWQFGLHNRDVKQGRKSEDLKKKLAAACELGGWDEFSGLVVDHPEDVLKAYSLDHGEPKFSRSQVRYLLTLDALTIFFVFSYFAFPPVTPVEKMKKGVQLIRTSISWGYRHVPIDLFLFENQIPIDLLTKVISTCYEKWGESNWAFTWDIILKENVSQMCGYIFKLPGDHPAKIDKAYPQGELEKCPHVLDCVYKILCGGNFERRPGGERTTIRPATALRKAGIQIKGSEGVLDQVRFSKRCLNLPIVTLYDNTESYFRNLAMYEFMAHHNSFKCAVGEYVQLMTSLVKEVEDVKHLIDCGVIQNKLGSHESVFKMWNSLQSDLFLPQNSEDYENMVLKINEQCKSSLNVMRTEFKQLVCSRPWLVVGGIATAIIVFGTVILDYTGIIGSDKMQPHFPS